METQNEQPKNNAKIKESILKKRTIGFIINVTLTYLSIIIVLPLMLSSDFLSNILDGNKKLIFYIIMLLGALINTIYLWSFLFIKISTKDALYLALAGTKKETLFYELTNSLDEENKELSSVTIDNNIDDDVKAQELSSEVTNVNKIQEYNDNNLDEEENLNVANSSLDNESNSDEVIEIQDQEPDDTNDEDANDNKSLDNQIIDKKYKVSKKAKYISCIANISDLYTVICVAFLIVAILFCFFLFPATVQGDCMQPLLYGQKYDKKGDKIVALKNKSFDALDVVVFQYDYDIQAVGSVANNELLVKRIIAKPGDKFECINGVIYINDNPLDEEYVKYPYGEYVNYNLNKIIRFNSNFESMNYDDSNIVPDGYYVLLGDNRVVANDSHYFGLVNEDQICGVVKLYKNDDGWHRLKNN